MPYEFILTEIRGRVAVVTLNRPAARNALNAQMLGELMEALESFDRDESVGATVVTGSEKAFAAGADIKEMAGRSSAEMMEGSFISDFGRLVSLRKPLIAAVSGWVLGGGCEIALACDMIIASDTAKFGQPEITLGVIPGGGGTQRLTWAVGKSIAMEMILNNRTLSAEEALQFGLVNQVVPPELCVERAIQLAGDIASRPPLAVRAAKRMINLAYGQSLVDGLREERQGFYGLFGTEDQEEGMQAFIDKRQPTWKGR
jgi:enoyl-CoA hydratase